MPVILASNGDVLVIVKVKVLVCELKEQVTVAVAKDPFALPTIWTVSALAIPTFRRNRTVSVKMSLRTVNFGITSLPEKQIVLPNFLEASSQHRSTSKSVRCAAILLKRIRRVECFESCECLLLRTRLDFRQGLQLVKS